MNLKRVAASLGLLTVVGAANLTIAVTHDDLPEETSWGFTKLDNDMELFSSGSDPLVNSTETFINLTAGTYQFVMQDTGVNGICCSNGTGQITFSNETHLLYQDDGNFTDVLKIDVKVDMDGSISSIAPVKPPPDTEWPGYFHNATDHSFALNVKFDQHPENLTILLLKKDDTYFNPGWLSFYDYGGVVADAGTLWTVTFDNVKAGVYFLRLSSAGTTNGLVWSTITNHTDVVWEIQGDEFTDHADFFFMVVGWHGNVIPTHWTGNPPPEP